MTRLRLPLLFLAILGLVFSLIAHVPARFGFEQPLGEAAWLLHIGIFLVLIPAAIITNSDVAPFKRGERWKALRGCPTWMRWMLHGFFLYAIVNFALFFLAVMRDGELHDELRGKRDRDQATPASVFVGFSGHWMVFYAGAIAMLYSSLVAQRTPARRCPKGHTAAPSAKFCRTCGLPIE